jgi:hypothetical protein
MENKKAATTSERPTTGTLIAGKNRAKMNRLNDAQRTALLTRGMQLIYGGSATAKKVPVSSR